MYRTDMKGFTLIELLISIAIIGIIAAIVIGALSGTRTRARDTALKSSMASLRSQAAIFSVSSGAFGGASAFAAIVDETSCTTAGTIFDQTDGIGKNLTEIAHMYNTDIWSVTCAVGDSTHDSWAASVPLISSGSWCVDSTGVSQAGTATGGGSENAVCI